jgi:hypothetical protein
VLSDEVRMKNVTRKGEMGPRRLLKKVLTVVVVEEDVEVVVQVVEIVVLVLATVWV